MEELFASLTRRQSMMLLTAVTFGGQEAAVPVLAHLPDDEAALLRHRAEKLLEIPRERRVPLLVQEIKKLVTARRTHLWSAEPEALARMLEKERPALRELILRALPVALADAVRLHLPAVAVQVREEVSPGVLGVIRWKLEGLLQEASAGTLWKFSDLLMLKPRELYTLADRQGCRALATAFAALLAEEQAQLLGTLPPEISQLAQRAIAAAVGRELSQADARALLSQHGVESSPLEGIRSAGIQRLARACLAQGPEFAARLVERHRPPFAPVFQKWMNDERTRAAARGDGGRTEVVADLERLEARGLVEKPSRLPAMSRKPVVPPPAATARPPPAAPRPSSHAGAFSPIAPRPPQSGSQPGQVPRPDAPARVDTPPVPPPAGFPGTGRPRPRDSSGDATWEAPPGPLDPRVVTAVKRTGFRADAHGDAPAPEQEALHSDFPATPMPSPPRTSSLRPAHEVAEDSPPHRVPAPALERRPASGPLRAEFRPAHEQDPRVGVEAPDSDLEPGPTSPQRPGRGRPPPDAAPVPSVRAGPDEDEATQALRVPRPPRDGERRASGGLDRAVAEPAAGSSRDGGGTGAPSRGVKVGGAAEDPSTAPRPRHLRADAAHADEARTALPRVSQDGGRPMARATDEGSAPPRGTPDRSGSRAPGPQRMDAVARPSREGGPPSPGRSVDGREGVDGARRGSDSRPNALREGGRPVPGSAAEGNAGAAERFARGGGRSTLGRADRDADGPGTEALPRVAREAGQPSPGRAAAANDGAGAGPAGRVARGEGRSMPGRTASGAEEPGTESLPRVAREAGQPSPGRAAAANDGAGAGPAGRVARADGRSTPVRADRDADGPGTEALPRVAREAGQPSPGRAAAANDGAGAGPAGRVARGDARSMPGRMGERQEGPGVEAAGRDSGDGVRAAPGRANGERDESGRGGARRGSREGARPVSGRAERDGGGPRAQEVPRGVRDASPRAEAARDPRAVGRPPAGSGGAAAAVPASRDVPRAVSRQAGERGEPGAPPTSREGGRAEAAAREDPSARLPRAGERPAGRPQGGPIPGGAERSETAPRSGQANGRERSTGSEPETESQTRAVPRAFRGTQGEPPAAAAGPAGRLPTTRPLAPPPPRPAASQLDSEPETTSAVAFEGKQPAPRRSPGPEDPSEGDSTQDLSGVLASMGMAGQDEVEATEEIPRQRRRANSAPVDVREPGPAAGAGRRQGAAPSGGGEAEAVAPLVPPVRDPVAARAARRAGALSTGSPIPPGVAAAPVTAPALPSQKRPPVAVATRVPQRRRSDSRIRKAEPAAPLVPSAPVDAPAPPSRSPRVVVTVPRRKAVKGPGHGPGGGSG